MITLQSEVVLGHWVRAEVWKDVLAQSRHLLVDELSI